MSSKPFVVVYFEDGEEMPFVKTFKEIDGVICSYNDHSSNWECVTDEAFCKVARGALVVNHGNFDELQKYGDKLDG